MRRTAPVTLAWGLSVLAGLASAGLDVATRALHARSIVAGVLAVACFGVAGYASGLMTAITTRRAALAIAAGTLLYAALTVAWILALGGPAAQPSVAGIAAAMALPLGIGGGLAGFSGGRQRRARG